MIVWPTANRAAVVGVSIVTCGAVLPASIGAETGDDWAPSLSRTVKVAVKVPAVVYVWLVVAELVVWGGEPSPKFQV